MSIVSTPVPSADRGTDTSRSTSSAVAIAPDGTAVQPVRPLAYILAPDPVIIRTCSAPNGRV